MVFPVVMYGCKSWTVKKAEHQRIDAFELVLEKPLESPGMESERDSGSCGASAVRRGARRGMLSPGSRAGRPTR